MNPWRVSILGTALVVYGTANFFAQNTPVKEKGPSDNPAGTGAAVESRAPAAVLHANGEKASLEPGIVVEQVDKGSAAEKMGFRPGDVLRSWNRGEHHGDFDSPLDLLDVEIEELPRGAVHLDGFSGSNPRSWTWTESTGFQRREGTWGLTLRPNFLGSLLAKYEAGLEAERSGKAEEAAQLWKDIVREEAPNNDPHWLISWFWLRAADSLASQKKQDSAENSCNQAISLARKHATNKTAELLRACGDLLFKYNVGDDGRSYYQQALAELERFQDRDLDRASVLNLLGLIAYYKDELSKAEDLALQARKIQENLVPESLAFAHTLNRVGVFLQSTGKLDQSKDYLMRNVALREKLAPEGAGLAVALQNLADTLTMRGDVSEAEKYGLRALALWQKLAPDSLAYAGCLVDVASIAEDRGHLAEAEDDLRRALAIQTRLAPGGSGMASSLNNLGNVLEDRGQMAEAERYFLQALEINEKRSPGSLRVAVNLGNLAMAEHQQGNLAKAEEYLTGALKIRERLSPNNMDLGIAYTTAGQVAMEKGDLDASESYYRRALALLETQSPMAPETADAFNDFASLALNKGNLAEAEKNYLRALQIRESGLGPASSRHAETLMDLAEVALRKKQPDVAADLFERGLRALESQTSWLGGPSEARADFRAAYERHVKVYADLLVRQGKAELAFYALERARARTLLETLAAARVEITKGADPELLQQEKALRDDIAATSDRRIHMLSDKAQQAQVNELDKHLSLLIEEYQQLEGRIRTTSPGYAALTQPRPLTAGQFQQLLDEKTVLLEYSLADQQSYVFVLNRESVSVYQLPGRGEIEALARRVYDSLTARSRTVEKENPGERQNRYRKADADYHVAARQLSQILLGPVGDAIKDKRLLVVSDGALQYIPFAALPDPHSPTLALITVGHEIVHLPSASVVALLRRQQDTRKSASKTVAVLADPVFSARDTRLSSDVSEKPEHSSSAPPEAASSEEALSGDLLTRSVRDIGLNLTRLPFSRREAEAIMAMTPASEGMEALDFNATLDLATSRELARYRIVHFATHGLLDSQHPELSGLVLSLVDKHGRPRRGFLTLDEIYNLDWTAELVVLSSCETGLGKEINGEGLIGLTRGFMYAGASRVVASLWNVSDVATAELMRYFYQGMLRDHLAPAAALQRAQVRMLKQSRWKSPYYWAAFQIQGEWK